MICQEASLHADYPLGLGIATEFENFVSLGREYLALDAIQKHDPSIAHDAVARRELQNRTTLVSNRLHDSLTNAIWSASWIVKGEEREFNHSLGLSALASMIADEAYCLGPTIFSELVNRQYVSSNTQAALNALAAAMVDSSHSEVLGFVGFPAERGIYETVLRASYLHQKQDSNEQWHFVRPSLDTHCNNLVALWESADNTLNGGCRQSLVAIHDVWSKPPFGVRKGLLGVLGLTYILSKRLELAVYKQGVFQIDLDRDLAHLAMRDPKLIELQLIESDSSTGTLLQAYSQCLYSVTEAICLAEPLAIGRVLVKIALELPGWSKRTSKIPSSAIKLRRLLLQASDPIQLLFHDIPELYQTQNPEEFAARLAVDLTVLISSYPTLLKQIQSQLHKVLAIATDKLELLHARASTVKGLSGDFRLDSFASRLMDYDGTLTATENLACLAVSLPARDWTDSTPDSIGIALADLSLKFRHAEMLANVKGRSPSRHAIGIVFGTGENTTTLMKSVDVGPEEKLRVSKISKKILQILSDDYSEMRLGLAALAEAGASLLEKEKQSDI